MQHIFLTSIFSPGSEFCLSVCELSPLYALLIRNKQTDSGPNFPSHNWSGPSLSSLATHHTRRSSTHREQIKKTNPKADTKFKKGKENYWVHAWDNCEKEELSWKFYGEYWWS